MKTCLLIPVVFLLACGSPDETLFGSGNAPSGVGGASASTSGPASSSSGSGGSVSSSSSTSASSSSAASAAASSSSSGGGFYWKSGVQLGVAKADMTGWTECYSGLYADTNVSMAGIVAGCSGSKLALACRPKGAATFQVMAMGDRADVTFMTDPNDIAAKHDANGVGWYFSPWQWGFLPAQDQRKGGCDATGISPNAPGPDGDMRLCWTGNNGVLWVGYRCGYGSFENTPGFDYNNERVVLSAP